MNIYLAAPWETKDSIPPYASALAAKNYTITEAWWVNEDAEVAAIPQGLESRALADLIGVRRADVFLLFNTGKSEGKAVEMGYALALGIPVIVVGARTNLFHHLPAVRVVPSFKEALRLLALL